MAPEFRSFIPLRAILVILVRAVMLRLMSWSIFQSGISLYCHTRATACNMGGTPTHGNAPVPDVADKAGKQISIVLKR
jgi:hypothetical protein